MLLLRLVLVASVAVVGGLGRTDFINSNRFQTWAADLKPGFIIKPKTNAAGRRCYCKIPLGSSSSSSFSFNPTGIITSAPIESSSFEFVILTKGRKRNGLTTPATFNFTGNT